MQSDHHHQRSSPSVSVVPLDVKPAGVDKVDDMTIIKAPLSLV